jgi:hypothetical protein
MLHIFVLFDFFLAVAVTVSKLKIFQLFNNNLVLAFDKGLKLPDFVL